MSSLLLGVDTGGTFTDFVLFDGAELRIHKVLSTPDAPERAILQGIRELGLEAAMQAGEMTVVHGSTVATNAALEGKGVRTLFITNRGLGDLLSLGRQARADLYDLQPAPMPVPVPPALCLETGGRLGADGRVVEDLDTADLDALRAAVAEREPEAVAINLLFSWLDDRFERAIEAALPEDLFVSRASRILPELGEYERGITTWLNAWVGPLVARYLARLAAGLGDSRLAVMQSSGGTMAAQQAGDEAVHMLLSGPAGGLAGARYTGTAAGRTRLLTFDMGGTSTDVALIDGELQLTSEGRIGPWPVAVPMVDMHTIGAGGGSLASVDAGGLLRVGPESAGADPGPACYGLGGTQATVTDANLVLGRLRADAFLGGRMTLDVEAARRAVAALGGQLGLDTEAAAEGILAVANEHMAHALRVMSVQRGIDPRDLTLVSFGGAGGLHVCALAEALGMRQAMVPTRAGVLSALGMLAAPRARHLSRTHLGVLAEMNAETITTLMDALAAEGRRALVAEGLAAEHIDVQRTVDLRYQGQSSVLNVPWRDGPQAAAAFHDAHRARYGHALSAPVELVNVRVVCRGPEGRLPLVLPAVNGAALAPERVRVHGLVAPVPRYARDVLVAGQEITGPALITETVSTTWLAPGWRARVHASGSLLLAFGGC
ncbi:MAG TPA: hydantoinase/oxoprolinase family protein [Gammaproteobacteria bacterium]|nr:hydantoinase/oxoprolinase family protein [Gammaproteobacteria bacterium]